MNQMQKETNSHQKILKILRQSLPSELAQIIMKNPPLKQIEFTDVNGNNAADVAEYSKWKTLCSLLRPSLEQLRQPQKPQKNIQQPQPQPIILVFCQPSEQIVIQNQNDRIFPYVPVAYSSWLENAGAKCIPLPYNLNEGSIEFLLERANGLLIPGGGSNLYKNYNKKQGYGPVTLGFQKIYRFINKLWNKGVRFPIWGTCLGLQIMLMAISNDVKVLSNLNSRMHQLQIYTDYDNSLMKTMPVRLRLLVENKKLINFQHAHGISVSKFLKYPRLMEKLKITQISKDKDGKWFCSGMQGKDQSQPIFLSQYHPQKQAYQWSKNGDILSNRDSIQISQFYGTAFIAECKKCKPPCTFSDQSELIFHLIQQYKHIHTPQKMYKVFAIDFKYRDQESKKLRKDLRTRAKSQVVKQPFV